MKNFAIITLVLAVIGSIIGTLMMVAGNGGEQVIGSALLGGGFTGILLSCAIIALADIRAEMKVIRNEMAWTRDREMRINKGQHCLICATKVMIDNAGKNWRCPSCDFGWQPLSEDEVKV